MRAGDGERLHAEVASVLDWWTLAGVQCAVAERPRDWLKPAAPPASPPVTAEPVEALPGTLDAFLTWLARDGDPALLGPPERRVAPVGGPTAELMVVVDMPGPDDEEAGGLMSGPAGRLLDAMLRAIGARREAVWLAPLAPVRPVGGRIAPADLAGLGRLARHHVGLTAAKRVLLMGGQAAEAVLETPVAEARGRAHGLGSARAVATFSPQALLASPKMKPGAWADLRVLMREGKE